MSQLIILDYFIDKLMYYRYFITFSSNQKGFSLRTWK